MRATRRAAAFTERHGRSFVALLLSFLAWLSVYALVVIKGVTGNQDIDLTVAMAASAILTAAGTAYAAGSAFVKGREVSQPPAPTVNVEATQATVDVDEDPL